MARRGTAWRGKEIYKQQEDKMKKVLLSELILDYNLYPRSQVDSQHVHNITEAILAENKMPPVIADEKSMRVVDGFHRITAMKRIEGETAKIEVIFKKYASDAEIFTDAMKYNADHGRMLTKYDRTHCAIVAEKLHIDPEIIAGALKMTVDSIKELRKIRVGNAKLKIDKGRNTKNPIPLKRTISHMAGKTLTKGQIEANTKLSGMDASFYANQLIMLIENNLLDMNNEKLLERLSRLQELLENMKVAA